MSARASGLAGGPGHACARRDRPPGDRCGGGSVARIAGCAAGRCLALHVVENPLQLGPLPAVAIGHGGHRIGGGGDRSDPGVDRFVSTQVVERDAQPIDQLGEPAGQVDGPAVDIVEGKDAAEEMEALLGHGHAEQDPVPSRLPGVGLELVELVGRAVRGVHPPTDAGRGDPLLHPGQVVVVDPEAAPDRFAAGEIEHLGRRQAGGRQVEQFGDDAEHRVGLAQGSVGQPDPQIGWAADGGDVLVVIAIAGTERGVDERGERLDVRAHHDHVAGFEGGVLGEPVQDGVAHDLDLTGPAVAGVDLKAVVLGVEEVTDIVPAHPVDAPPSARSARTSAWIRPSNVDDC